MRGESKKGGADGKGPSRLGDCLAPGVRGRLVQLRLQAGVALAQVVDFSLQPPLAAPVAQSC